MRLLGHSYFAEAEPVLHDIYDLLSSNKPPAARQRLVLDTEEGKPYWYIAE